MRSRRRRPHPGSSLDASCVRQDSAQQPYCQPLGADPVAPLRVAERSRPKWRKSTTRTRRASSSLPAAQRGAGKAQRVVTAHEPGYARPRPGGGEAGGCASNLSFGLDSQLSNVCARRDRRCARRAGHAQPRELAGASGDRCRAWIEGFSSARWQSPGAAACLPATSYRSRICGLVSEIGIGREDPGADATGGSRLRAASARSSTATHPTRAPQRGGERQPLSGARAQRPARRLARDRLDLGDLLRGESGAGDPTRSPPDPQGDAHESVVASGRQPSCSSPAAHRSQH